MNFDKAKYGPWALVTGAARGMGAEFARQLAAQGLNIVLLDRDTAGLEQCERGLREAFAIETRVVVEDLSRDDFMQSLIPEVEGLEIGLLVNNAALVNIGAFLPQSSEFLLSQLQVNCRAVLLLTHHFAGLMVERGQGGIINLSSGAAELVSAYNAHYAATKAYDLKLAEALWAELKPQGIDVLGFMPGSTRTEGFLAQGGNGDAPLVMDVEATVAEALRFLGKRPSVLPGGTNRLMNFLLTRLLPRAGMIRFVSAQLRTQFRLPRT